MKKILLSMFLLALASKSMANDFEDVWGYISCHQGNNLAYSHLYKISIKGTNETYSSQKEKDRKKAVKETGYDACSVFTTYNKWSYEKYQAYVEEAVQQAKHQRSGGNGRVSRFRFSE